MRNRERGVVWEETLILLPSTVRFVFLSATIPNSRQFASWISKLKSQPVHIVYTEYRPTPLEHYVYPIGGQGLYLVVDKKSEWRDENFSKAQAVLKAEDPASMASAVGSSADTGEDKKKKPKKSTSSDLYKIVRLIQERNYDPAIIFSFSKRECEQNAVQMAKLDFCTDDERHLIDQIYRQALASLNDDDRQLPAVLSLLPLLRRGIGIHHGGLLSSFFHLVVTHAPIKNRSSAHSQGGGRASVPRGSYQAAVCH